jgi:hypothetical protein
MIKMNAKFKSTCECGHEIQAGDAILFFPAQRGQRRGRALCVANCEERARRAAELAEAEEFAREERLSQESLCGVYDGAPSW